MYVLIPGVGLVALELTPQLIPGAAVLQETMLAKPLAATGVG